MSFGVNTEKGCTRYRGRGDVIVIHDHPVEQVQDFKFLGCTLNYAFERDTPKLNNVRSFVEQSAELIEKKN